MEPKETAAFRRVSAKSGFVAGNGNSRFLKSYLVDIHRYLCGSLGKKSINFYMEHADKPVQIPTSSGTFVADVVPDFEFINAIPSNRNEKAQNGRKIRSKAMILFRAQQRSQNKGIETSSSKRKLSKSKQVSAVQLSSFSTSNDQKADFGNFVQHVSDEVESQEEVTEASETDNSVGLVTRDNSPVSLLGAGRIDPFSNYPTSFASPELDLLIDHC
jgi:hypothetical protein